MTLKFVVRAGAALSIIYTTGCIPLTVGSTAQPVPVGTTVHSMSMYVVPNSVDDSVNNRSFPRYGIDPEVRFGLDDRSDIGVRTPSFSGIVANYKRRLNGVSQAPGAATAMMVGGGLVNWGDHAHLEATLITSAEDNDRFTPYSGIRAMQVIPSTGARFTIPQRSVDLWARGSVRAQRESPPRLVFSTTTLRFDCARGISSSFRRSPFTETSRDSFCPGSKWTSPAQVRIFARRLATASVGSTRANLARLG